MQKPIQVSLALSMLLTTNLIAEEKLKDIEVVSATKTLQKIDHVTSNINVITAQEIEERQYTTVTQALNSVAGLSFSQNGGVGQTTSVRVRAFDPDQVIVLIDGIRYNDLTSTAGAAFEHLMINDIERIEVVKGAQSGIWGADAAAGVINIITKSAKEGLHFNASSEFGSFNSSNIKANGGYKNENFYLKVAHSHLASNGITAQVPKNSNLHDYEDDAYSNKTTTLKAGLTITPTDKIDFTHTIVDADTQFDGGFFPLTATQIANNTDYSSITDTKLSAINYNHIDSFNEVNIYAKKSSFSRVSKAGTSNSFFDGEVKEYGLSLKIPYFNKHFLQVGGDYKTFEHFNSINKKTTNKALFITNNNILNNFLDGKTIITQSLRNDYYDTFDNQLTGKIGLKHYFDTIDGLSSSVNYGTAFNAPTLSQLHTPTYGNTALEPEETKSFDLSVKYKDFTLTYFHNKVDNLISFHPTTYQNINIEGTSTIKGYEASYEKMLNDNLLISLNYTYLDAKDKDDNTLLRRPKESVKFALDYYGIEKLHLGLNGEYVGDRKDNDFSTFPASSVETGNYTVANFATNYEISKEMSLFGKVENLTDKKYQNVFGYTTTPRAFYAGMKISY
jgi:vitamin B12 transporter